MMCADSGIGQMQERISRVHKVKSNRATYNTSSSNRVESLESIYCATAPERRPDGSTEDQGGYGYLRFCLRRLTLRRECFVALVLFC